MRTFPDDGPAATSSWLRYGVLVPGYTILVASLVLTMGWLIAPDLLRPLNSTLGGVEVLTALGFVLLACALLIMEPPDAPLRRVGQAMALGAAILGAGHLLGQAEGWRIAVEGNALLGKMPAVTALNLMLTGFAILLLDTAWGRFRPSSLLNWTTAGLSFLTLTGFAYDAENLAQLRGFAGVSLATSLTFLFFCQAILFARPQRGMAAVLLSRNLGGAAARRLLPSAIFLPFVVSLIILKLHYSGAYGTALMVFLFVVAPVLIFVPLVLLSATMLNRLEIERQRSDAELLSSTQRFSSVVASAMDAIIILDDEQHIVVFNQSAERVFGCPAWEVLGKRLDRFLPLDMGELHLHYVQRFAHSGVTTRSMMAPGSLMARRSNGEEFPIEATISQVRVGGQRLFTVILRDITQRKQAEETLRHSEERFRSIYEQAAVGIHQVAHDGSLLMVNAAFCRMLGYSEAELCQKKISEIIHPDDRERERQLMDEIRQGKRSSFQIEKRYLHSNGSSVWVNVTASMVHGASGEPLYRLSVVQDITERKRAEEQLMQAQKMEAIGRLAGGVAHDFNTLLNVMLGYSELLLEELALGDPRRDHVTHIKNSGEAAAMLTRQLLAFSRKQPLMQEVVDLREVTERMAPIVSRLLRDDVELLIKSGDEPCPVKVDPGQMQQLVLNLAANAGDAMPEGGQISIDVRAVTFDEVYVKQHPRVHPGHYAMLSISDTGTGMDSETLAHIFEPFFTTKGSGKGTGLGLATVYGIARNNGGDIWVYSELGVGTVFKVYLPLTAETPRIMQPAALPSSHASGGGETVLLVEDQEALRDLTEAILTRNGYKVICAEDGIAALAVAKDYPQTIHLLLTDVVMPRLRGPELASQLLRQFPNIGVVFLSGYTEEAISHMAGGSGFLLVEKPYTADALLNAVRRALDDRALRTAPAD